MYCQSNPVIVPQFAWSYSVDYCFWLPAIGTDRNTKIVCEEFSIKNQKDEPINFHFLQKLCAKFKQFQQALAEQQLRFKKQLNDKDKIHKKAIKLKEHYKNRNLIIREFLEKTLQSENQWNMQNIQQLKIVNKIVSYFLEVYTTDPYLKVVPSKTERIYKWLMENRETNKSSQNHQLEQCNSEDFISIFKSGNLYALMQTLDALFLRKNLSPDETAFHLDFMDIIFQKLKVFTGGSSNFLSREKLSPEEYFSHLTNQMDNCNQKFQYYKEKFPKSDILLILQVMGGDVQAMKKMAGNDWRLYIMFCIAYKEPWVNPSDIYDLARWYVRNNKIKLSKKQKMEIILLDVDFERPYILFSQVIPQPLMSTVALIACELNLFKQSPRKDSQNGATSKKQIVQQLTYWMSDPAIPWKIKAPYIQIYIKTFNDDSSTYLDVVLRILQSMESYHPIQTKQQYLKVTQYCNNVRELKLPVNKEADYLKNLVIHQIIQNSFDYIFELIKLYEEKEGKEDLLEQMQKDCLIKLQNRDLNYKHLASSIKHLSPLKFSRQEKQRLMQMFNHVCILYEASITQSPGYRKQIVNCLMQHQHCDLMIGDIILLYSELMGLGFNRFEEELNDLKVFVYQRQSKRPKIYSKLQKQIAILNQMWSKTQ